MNSKLLTLAIIEILISIGVSVAIIFVSFKILKLFNAAIFLHCND